MTSPEEHNGASATPGEGAKNSIVNMNRRAFLAFLVGSTALFIGDIVADESQNVTKKGNKAPPTNARGPDPEQDIKITKDISDALNPIKAAMLIHQGLERNFNSIAAYFRTILESCLSTLAIAKLNQKKQRDYPQIRTGNQAVDAETVNFTQAILVTPFVEEYFFRLVLEEIMVSKHEKGFAWIKGIKSSVLFGLCHNIRFKLSEEGLQAILAYSVPIEQTISGLFKWYLLRKKQGGILHSTLAHSIHNSIASYLIWKKRKGSKVETI